jgi:hypothetical protein
LELSTVVGTKMALSYLEMSELMGFAAWFLLPQLGSTAGQIALRMPHLSM